MRFLFFVAFCFLCTHSLEASRVDDDGSTSQSGGFWDAVEYFDPDLKKEIESFFSWSSSEEPEESSVSLSTGSLSEVSVSLGSSVDISPALVHVGPVPAYIPRLSEQDAAARDSIKSRLRNFMCFSMALQWLQLVAISAHTLYHGSKFKFYPIDRFYEDQAPIYNHARFEGVERPVAFMGWSTLVAAVVPVTLAHALVYKFTPGFVVRGLNDGNRSSLYTWFTLGLGYEIFSAALFYFCYFVVTPRVTEDITLRNIQSIMLNPHLYFGLLNEWELCLAVYGITAVCALGTMGGGYSYPKLRDYIRRIRSATGTRSHA